VQSHSIIPRALRQQATHNIDMAVELKEGGKQSLGRLQSASQCAPRRAGKPSGPIEPQRRFS